jgi:hypothetical protein
VTVIAMVVLLLRPDDLDSLTVDQPMNVLPGSQHTNIGHVVAYQAGRDIHQYGYAEQKSE